MFFDTHTKTREWGSNKSHLIGEQMKKKKVLIGCEFSGRIRDAFEKQGCEAVSCDLLPSDKPGKHYQGDIFDVIDYPWDIVILHPPCTDTSVSGAKHFEEKKQDGRQYRSVAFFMKLVRRTNHIPCVVIEHPISIMSSLYKKPTQIIQPWMFGHGETKATCLWLKGLPKLEPSNIVEGREARIHRLPPSKDRWKERSTTFPGIAKAMAEQWGSKYMDNKGEDDE